MSDSTNPYQAPASARPPAPTSADSRVSGARRVPSGNGTNWVSEGLSLAKSGAPGIIIVLLLMLIPYAASELLADYLASLSPFGTVGIGILFGPFYMVFWGGMMAGFEHCPFQAKVAIQAMRESFEPLFILGLLTTAVFAGIGVSFAAAAMLFADIAPTDFAGWENLDVTQSLALIAAGFVVFVLYLATTWFSPALVTIGNVRPLPAMTRSFKACFKNFSAFFVLAIMSLLILFALGLLVSVTSVVSAALTGVVDSFLTSDISTSAWAFISLLFGQMLNGILSAWVAATQYSSFRDVFVQQDE